MNLLKACPAAVVAVTFSVSPLLATDWESLPYTTLSAFQAVNADGTSAYSGGFPVKMYGVVIANTEDWLDPTPAYDSGVHLWQMGGQAELIVQAVAPGDSGGAYCWMGQNYGNHIGKQDAAFSYTNSEWTAELGRLGLYGGDGVTDPIRAGALVEIRANMGLHRNGKMNVNEAHDKRPQFDFEIVVLNSAFGLPEAAEVVLSQLKEADDTFIFDPSRQSGCELHQGTLVELRNVWVDSAATWTNKSYVTVTDGVRSFPIRLGRNPSFDGTELFAPGEAFNVVGVMNQDSVNGRDGYYLIALNAGDFTLVPEPASLAMLAAGGILLRRSRRRLKRRHGGSCSAHRRRRRRVFE